MNSKEERFKTIVAENEERIKRICRYYCSNVTDTDDICQEVLINIWKSLDNFRGDSSMSTWVYRIAVNTALTHAGRSLKNLNFRIDDDAQRLQLLVADDEAEQSAWKESQLEALKLEINQLSIIDKTLVSLVLEDLSGKEIANIIGLTEPNVRVKLHRIKELLRSALIKNLSI